MHSHPTHRFLIYVVAYEAQSHITDVFERVPSGLFNRADIHFLVSDDASNDDGVQVLRDWLVSQDIRNVTVVQNRVNQGYGGNQKIGFRLAIDRGYDCVVLLHGDGQYAPELLPKFIETWNEKQPDVILGSRMHSKLSAIKGGMPIYKVAGNRLLTRFQNRLTGLRLSEFHTGYRAYSTAFLSSVPFETNTNDFHFDTEILLQAAHLRAEVEEFAIPTHYGNEVCRVSGLRYAWNVIRSTIQFKMHQLGMLCSLQLRNLSIDRYRDKTTSNYSSHSLALRILERQKALSVLDIGCGPGHVAARCSDAGIRVTGIDCSDPNTETMAEFHLADLERDPLPVRISEFDAVLMLDIIEHLSNPEQFLLGLRNDDAPSDDRNPVLLLSTPNVAFIAIRLNLLCGRFNYAERGILDITHKRLFTKKSLLRLLRDCGFKIRRVHAVGVPFEAVMPGRTGRFLGACASLAAKLWPSMFAFQFLVECEAQPGVSQVLQNALRIHGAVESIDQENHHPRIDD